MQIDREGKQTQRLGGKPSSKEKTAEQRKRHIGNIPLCHKPSLGSYYCGQQRPTTGTVAGTRVDSPRGAQHSGSYID